MNAKPNKRTLRLDSPPSEAAPKDHCSVTMLTGPRTSALCIVEQALELGRDPQLPWPLEDAGISARHSRIFQLEGGFWLQDLGSTNGTWLNGKRLSEPVKLSDGDRVQLGKSTILRVTLQDAAEQEAARRLYQQAVRDPLTGAFNRGHLESTLTTEYAFARRHSSLLGVLFLDIDHFGVFNDTHGHQAGDAVLCAVARTILGAIRAEDVFARYGGEEFVIVARGVDLAGGLALGERIRQKIAALVIPFQDESLTVTTSIGVACFQPSTPFESAAQLVAAADRGVYQAKAAGRNGVYAVRHRTTAEVKLPSS